MAEPEILPALTSNLSEALGRGGEDGDALGRAGWLLCSLRHGDALQLLFLPFGSRARLLYTLPLRQYFAIDGEDLEFLRGVEQAGPHLTRLQRLALRYADAIQHGLRQGLESPDDLK